MKAQMIGQRTVYQCDDSKSATQFWHRIVAALTLSVLLLAGSIAVFAQSPPLTYNAQTNYWAWAGWPPVFSATGTDTGSGTWNFNVAFPTGAHAYAQQLQDCLTCVLQDSWSYDFYGGGTFSLSGTDTFDAIFTSGYAAGFSQTSGPVYQSQTIDMYFTGQWQQSGLKQSGFMQLSEVEQDGPINGTATLRFAPAPEPGSILLLGSGFLGLVGVLRRRLLG